MQDPHLLLARLARNFQGSQCSAAPCLDRSEARRLGGESPRYIQCCAGSRLSPFCIQPAKAFAVGGSGLANKPTDHGEQQLGPGRCDGPYTTRATWPPSVLSKGERVVLRAGDVFLGRRCRSVRPVSALQLHPAICNDKRVSSFSGRREWWRAGEGPQRLRWMDGLDGWVDGCAGQ